MQGYAQDGNDDLKNDDPMSGWNWVHATYENGTIMCTVPVLDYNHLGGADIHEGGGLSFNVDVALNGQQFTGKPLQFRYYDIHIDKIDPSIGSSEGGTVINVRALTINYLLDHRQRSI